MAKQPKRVDKAQAVMTIMSDQRVCTPSTASATRVVKACRALRLDDTEIVRVMYWLEYCNQNGDAYSSRIKRVWP